ncbi:MAG: S8 family peptidase [Bacteroidales bacterium]|nr:S8 family peptidase [Bacteroidales bacterium]
MRKTLMLTWFLLGCNILFAQTKAGSILNNWFNKSPIDDKVYGAEVYKAYDFLKGKKSKTVIVAVIDAGIDINHEDLKENIWVNPNEIPDNGIDDDNNGYIDDVNGWNFLGNAKGQNISFENTETARIYKRFKDKEKSEIDQADRYAFKFFKKVKRSYNRKLKDAERTKEWIVRFKNRYKTACSNICNEIGKDSVTIADLDSLRRANKSLKRDIKFMFMHGFDISYVKEFEENIDIELTYHLNLDYNPRDIIGDDVRNLKTSYGNNNIYGPEASHGTFVAGIIAAKRDNNLGIDGVAENVKIMGLKAVPNGDERDKDIAKAVRYAVDNGAQIINMSFGKSFSPYKYLVDEAFEYAEKKGILLVHAAGNESYNIDKVKQYPTKHISKTKSISSWITVGASGRNKNSRFVANYTNYGKENVDIFAPGTSLRSLAPESKYSIGSGTSYAAPVVSGVAALLLSYYPQLTANQLKDIILQSAVRYKDTKVTKPGTQKKQIQFEKLSKTGGLVNAYEAVKMADAMTK